ncbi:hypothetical protein J8Z82_14500 [Yersinia enterocolitica]|uniref:hypothetical protein n=1 Tax=Yersinia enterocolitica TaxID=630 RepID=UPI001C8D9D5B|nr:hypothetical protein [Yersinia enterocolitica]MBX9488788.1 hypothetical protein [Yersinia enterocolitica]MBX9492984.1 hypothetical protein [Yersinia enterocolitica]
MLSKEELEHRAKWPDGTFDKEAATELLSLREQLAELKAFISNECFIIDPEDDENCIRAEYHTKYGELFTAAKPAGLDVEDITEFMRKAFWRGFESARCTENSNIPADWKDSKPNLLLALKAKISED